MVWAFTRTTQSGLTIAADTNEFLIEGLRRVSTLRLTSPEPRKLSYEPFSYIENNTSLPDVPGLVATYDLFMRDGKWYIRFWRTPEIDHEFAVTYYTFIPIPQQDDEELNIPDDYLLALLDYARYFYLRNFSSELERARTYKEDAETGLARALRDDRRHPDYNERHMAAIESGYPTFYQDDVELLEG